ncbi:MAG: SlyX family protein [Gammaproteobacteria bacterium]|nr:SlyX family protein [Gammaproteobacteria bacterium]
MTQTRDETLRLEMLVTEHERLLEQFSELLQDQQSQIDRLKHKLERLEQRLSESDEPGTDLSADEPPPHY